MRIVDIRPEQENEDIKSGKDILSSELAHQAKSVMIIVGDSPNVSQFADRVGIRSNPFPWREAVWLKVTPANALKVLSKKQAKDWFPTPGESAVVLNFMDEVAARLEPSANLVEIELAFLKAGS